ncbi:hypothetical protein PSHT_06440 [Puccinia striiformis]|uniref:Uncharacterized protein n=2 Tax=Puccinia striiformis TaxID=27350 RepID=A0A0L0VGU2_9BASI|nr:hypothetical protein PSTG_08192 [Puccinia striiformis f. sp. tritici PST-78]POW17413.1 hypothetical protein PSHT_06440 [Puccinia striiformis]
MSRNGSSPAAQSIASWKACQLVRTVMEIKKRHGPVYEPHSGKRKVGRDDTLGASTTREPYYTLEHPGTGSDYLNAGYPALGNHNAWSELSGDQPLAPCTRPCGRIKSPNNPSGGLWQIPPRIGNVEP